MTAHWCWPPYTGKPQKAHLMSRSHSGLVVANCGRVFEALDVRPVMPANEEKCRACVKAEASRG